VCTELDVGVGRVDAVFIDICGRLTLVECKLWQNPEARRKVVAQILDYAAALLSWSYGDLQRQVARRLGRPGNVLFEVDRLTNPGLDEASFVDGVSRGLREGDFTLLVLGDGIRRETHVLNEYLQTHARLRFRFGLVEVAPYLQVDGTILLHPRVRARTEALSRPAFWIDEQPNVAGATEASQDTIPTDSEQPTARLSASGSQDRARELDLAFWTPFLKTLRLDDPEQPVPHAGPSQLENRRFPLPMGAWLTAFRTAERGRNRVGVMFRTRANADNLWDILESQREEIFASLQFEVEWAGNYITRALFFDDIHDERTWPQQREFLRDTVNTFVSVFRPRLK
jgi:hypothetical protein